MDFIFEVENSLSSELCENIIKLYENSTGKDRGPIGGNCTIDKNVRSTENLIVSGNPDKEWMKIDEILHKKLRDGLTQYIKYMYKYCPPTIHPDVLFRTDEGYEIQKMASGDFYDWHFDDDDNGRKLTAIWYLNTMEEYEGGSTDFWCGKRVTPKQGTLLLFPSTWSFIHREAPVKNGGTKYTCITWLK